MNVPEMQRLIAHMKALPPIPAGVWHVDSAYPPIRLMGPVFQELSCGTVGCICGEWALMNGKSLQYLRGITIFRDFSEALALKVEAVNCLIEASEWLDGFYAKYLDLPKDYYTFAVWAVSTAIARSQEAYRREMEERYKARAPRHPDVDRLEAMYDLPATWVPQERPDWVAKFERENERWDR